MPIDLGKAKSFTSGAENVSLKDLITNDNYIILTHKNLEERGFDLSVDQSLQSETPQPIKTTPVTVNSFPINLPSNRLFPSITFQANIATSNAILNIRRAGESFYQKTLGVLPAGVETKIDLTGVGYTLIDLIDGTGYVITLLESNGSTITLDGNGPNEPFYSWEFHTYNFEQLGYKSDTYPIVKTGINGANFEDSSSLQVGGNCLVHTDKVNDTMAAVIEQPFNSPNPISRREGTFIDNFPVFTILADTLTNPSFNFTPSGSLRITDLTMRSAGVQTNVRVTFIDSITGLTVTNVGIPSIPASGTFSINCLATTIGNVFQDINDGVTYILDVFSADGDVLLLGETATDQPWMNIDAYLLNNEAIPFFSDLGAIEGTFYVDINTSVPMGDRDGSIFRPYQQISEAQTGAGAATPGSQHTFIVASGSYTAITLGKFEHVISGNADGQSVIITSVTVNFSGGTCSLENLRSNDLIYDTTGAGDAAKTTLFLNNVDSNGGIVAEGRGAGSDIILQDGFRDIDDITATDVHYRINDVYPNLYNGVTSINSTALGVNLLDGHAAIMELNDVFIENSASINVGAAGNTSCKFIAITARDLPTLLTNRVTSGDTVTVAYDALSAPSSIIDTGMASTIELLDKAISVDYDNSTSGAASTNVQDVIDEAFAAQVENSIVRSGSFDMSPTEISIATATTFDTTTGDFAYIVDRLTGERSVVTYTGQSGLDITNYDGQDWTGVQRNVFAFIDVSVPELKLSFTPPGAFPDTFAYIGNFDLIETTIPFDTLGSANKIVHTAYSAPETSARLITSKGHFDLEGLVFTGGSVANMDLGITPGLAIREGSNTIANYNSPDIPPANTLDFISSLNRQYINTSGDTVTILETGQTLTSTEYAPGGVLTTVNPAGRFTIMYLFIYPGSWSARAMLGNKDYATIEAAEEDVVKDPLGQSVQTHEAVPTTALIVAGNAADLTNIAQAKFIALNDR